MLLANEGLAEFREIVASSSLEAATSKEAFQPW